MAGRKPIGDKAMTAGERQHRKRRLAEMQAQRADEARALVRKMLEQLTLA